jgi:hypothetical protein
MIKRVVQSPAFLVVLFLVALALVLVGGIGAAQSAPRIQSADWRGQVELTDISTSLLENGGVVASHGGEDASLGKVEGLDETGLISDYFFSANADKGLKTPDDFTIGESYKEELSVRNDGTIPEYVRVTVYRYWVDADGKKCTDLKPEYIEMDLTGTGWIEDTDAKTQERTVLYYSNVVDFNDGNNTTEPFNTTLRINPAVVSDSAYAGKEFRVKAVVDAVQTHNADQAKLSAWGTSK